MTLSFILHMIMLKLVSAWFSVHCRKTPQALHRKAVKLVRIFFLEVNLTKFNKAKGGFSIKLGLKQALATVNDYNPLMKDFPLDDLLAATELDKIRAALSAIFTHLKKIRSTKYPIQRALRLVEAISRDLSSQLLKVCYYSTCVR